MDWIIRGENVQCQCVTVDKTIQVGDSEYEVVALLCHDGNTISSGHYTAVIQSGDRWAIANDSIIEFVSEEEALRSSRNKVCAVVYKKASYLMDISMCVPGPEDFSQPLNTKTVNIQQLFPMLTAHLDSIMRGDSYSDRHSKYMRAVKDKHIKHVRLVSEELLLALLQQLEEHYYEVPPSVPVAPRDIFKPQQQKFFKLPSALKNNLKELGYFEVESAYLRDVLLVESIAFIARNILGLTEREARDATFA